MIQIRRLHVGVALVGLTSLLFNSAVASAAPTSKDSPPAERIRALQRERVKALEEHVEGLTTRVKLRGPTPAELGVLLAALADLTEASLDLANSPADEVAALERAVERFGKVESEMGDLVRVGATDKAMAAQGRAARLKAEVQLEKRKTRK